MNVTQIVLLTARPNGSGTAILAVFLSCGEEKKEHVITYRKQNEAQSVHERRLNTQGR